jgi:hypothetical protein
MEQVGSQIDCQARLTADGHYKLTITMSHRSVVTEKTTAGTSVSRNLIIAGTLLLRDGESGRFSAFDVVTGEILQADITIRLYR